MTNDISAGRLLRVGLTGVILLAGTLAMLLSPESAQAKPKRGAGKPPAAPGAAKEFSDENVKSAIDRAAAYLWSLQKPDGSWPEIGGYPDGPTALAVYALLESGVKPFNPKMEKALKWLDTVRTTKGYVAKTYCYGLRCQAWLSAIRQHAEYRSSLRRDAEMLVKAGKAGTFHYNVGAPEGSWDNSCTQYGHLGIWAAAMIHLEVPGWYWQNSLRHWLSTQCADGGWVYSGSGPKGTGPMTAAGLASMYVCFDNLFGDAYANCGGNRQAAAALLSIQKGLEWFDKNFAGTVGGVDGYYLYGVERIGLASGYKYFGQVDWYKAGAKLLLNNQAADGSWPGPHGVQVCTAQCLLFLVRGRQPVIFNKLQYDGDWNNRPRDLAMLTRWMMTDVFENEVFWQVISLKTDPSEWHDAPVLYIAGNKKPKFTEAELAKLRAYSAQGGTIFSVTECNGEGFEKGMKEVYSQLFPEYEMRDAPPNHELYTIQEDLTKTNVKFKIISNGIRPLAIHVSRDLPRSWQVFAYKSDKAAFQAALNVYLYANESTPQPRGHFVWPAAPAAAPEETLKLARIKHNGNWNPEPLAYERFARLIQEQTKIKIELAEVKPAELAGSGAKVATLTGTGELRLTAADGEALNKFVEAGGTLVVDAAGGDKKFGDSAMATLRRAFGPGLLERVTMNDPLMTVEKIEAIRYRKKIVSRMKGADLPLMASPAKKPGRVVFSFEDLTAALVGAPCAGCIGYHPETAYAILRNVVLTKLAKESPESAPAAETRPAE